MQKRSELSTEEIKIIEAVVMEIAPIIKINPATHMMPLESYLILMEALIKTGFRLR